MRLRWDHPFLLVAVIALLLAFPYTGVEPGRVQLAALCAINILLAQSINLLTGYAGQISLGHAGFFAAGAYGSAALALKLGWPIWITIPAGIVIAMALGLLVAIPAERVREFYLAMITLGFGFVAVEIMEHWTPVTGGFMGLSNIPSPLLLNLKIFGLSVSLNAYYYIVLALLALVTWLKLNLLQSYVGRSLVAVAGSELAAATLGIRPGRTKHLAYVLSAAIAGLAGGLYAHLVAYISPDTFSMWTSTSILVTAVFGGLQTMIGPFFGAVFFTFLPDQLQLFKDYQLLVYGLLLLVSYVILPKGIAGRLRGRTPFIRDLIRQRAAASVPVADPPSSPGQSASPAPSGPLLEVQGLTKEFDGIRALSDVTCQIRPGTIHGLIGPNGSGKSTLVNLVTGIYTPTRGTIRFHGREVQGTSPDRLSRMGVARIFQNPQVFPDMTVRENVLTGAYRLYASSLAACLVRAPGLAREEEGMVRQVNAIMERIGLTRYADELASNLPYGQKRMLEVARALVSNPTLLILDEPTAGLSETEVEQLTRVLLDLRTQGMTVLIIEHHMEFLLKLVDGVTVLDYGELIFHGRPADARRDARVIEAYLGRHANAGD